MYWGEKDRKLTECAKDDKGEGVSDDPFTDGAEDHEDAAKGEEDACDGSVSFPVSDTCDGIGILGWGELPVEAAPLPPAPRQPIRSHDNGVKLRRKPTRALWVGFRQQCISSYTISRENGMNYEHWGWVSECLS